MENPGHSPLGRVALGDMIRRIAARNPDSIAVIEGDAKTSYKTLDNEACRFANYLLQSGLQSGDPVAMLCNNSTDMLVAIAGIHKAGLVWVPLNTMLGHDDHDYILRHCEAKAIIADALMLGIPGTRALVAALDIPIIVIGATSTKSDIVFRDAVENASIEEPNVQIDAETLALVMYTSGTTARPKGVMHTHLSVTMAAMSNSIEVEMRRSDVMSAVLPLFHCAQYIVILGVLVSGGSTVLMRGFDPATILSAVEKHRITRLTLLPNMYAALLAHPDFGAHDLSSIRVCAYAMAPMPQSLIAEMKEKLCSNLMLGTGQTEMMPITSIFRSEQHGKRIGNYWGKPTLINDLAIMGEDGTLLPDGDVGEIVHRGSNVMLGYLKDDKATTAARRHGWHHTGDLGKIDSDGQLLFLDRVKDMIKSGGENVPSVKVEEVLLRHPAVISAAVIGLPHDRWVEAVCAIVVLHDGDDTDGPALIAHCREHLGGFEIPKSLHIVEALPMTATGKIRKVELREKYAQTS